MKRLFTVIRNQSTREAVHQFFKHKDYIIESYEDTLECLQEILNDVPDIVIAECQSRPVSGHELVKTVRNTFLNHDIVLILIGDASHLADRILADNAGASNYLTRPISMEQLSELVLPSQTLMVSNSIIHPHRTQPAESDLLLASIRDYEQQLLFHLIAQRMLEIDVYTIQLEQVVETCFRLLSLLYNFNGLLVYHSYDHENRFSLVTRKEIDGFDFDAVRQEVASYLFENYKLKHKDILSASVHAIELSNLPAVLHEIKQNTVFDPGSIESYSVIYLLGFEPERLGQKFETGYRRVMNSVSQIIERKVITDVAKRRHLIDCLDNPENIHFLIKCLREQLEDARKRRARVIYLVINYQPEHLRLQGKYLEGRIDDLVYRMLNEALTTYLGTKNIASRLDSNLHILCLANNNIDYAYRLKEQINALIDRVLKRHLRDINPKDVFAYGVFAMSLDEKIDEEKLISLAKRSTQKSTQNDNDIIDIVGL